MILLDGVRDECEAGAVLFAMPPGAVGAESLGESLIDFGVREGFGLAVIPAKACEGGKVGQKILFEVDAEAVFARDVPGMIGDFRNGRETRSKLAIASR